MSADAHAAPDQLRVSQDRRVLTVSFSETAYAIPAELLRVESPSAEVQGHDPSQKKLVVRKADVSISALHPTGNYAVRIVFDDGHDTGLYSWGLLERFGRERDEMLATYDAAVKAAGRER